MGDKRWRARGGGLGGNCGCRLLFPALLVAWPAHCRSAPCLYLKPTALVSLVKDTTKRRRAKMPPASGPAAYTIQFLKFIAHRNGAKARTGLNAAPVNGKANSCGDRGGG